MHSSHDTVLENKSAVILVTGFLGAGKTTLLKRILSWESHAAKTVVLVNEFGKVGIDGALLKTSGTEVVELTSGCICCTLSADLKQSLMRLWEDYRPCRIFIEASGVADPTTILGLMQDPQLAARLHLQNVVTVLDADFWEARDNFGPLFFNQLAAAHLILLNKIDQVDPARVPLYLKEIHAFLPDCRVIPTVHCAVDPDTLFSSQKIENRSPVSTAPLYNPFVEAHPATDPFASGAPDGGKASVSAAHFVTFSFVASEAMDQDRFQDFVQTLPWEVFRAKGTVRFADHTRFFNFVGGKSEWSPWQGEEKTRLAFIAWGVDMDDIERRLKACRVQQHL